MLKNKLALGTAQFGLDYGISNFFGKVKSKKIEEILNYAHANGIDTIDTAKSYGFAEQRIGSYLKKNKTSPWKIITKISSVEHIKNQVIDSKKKLNKRPHAILAHSEKIFRHKNFIKFVESLKKDPKFFFQIGVSVYNEEEINSVLKSEILPQIIQLPINILDQRLFSNRVLHDIASNGISIHARSIFLQGLFYLPKSIWRKKFEDAFSSLERLERISIKNNMTLSELSLLWVTRLNEIEKTIIGVESVDQLKQHFGSFKKKLNNNALDEIENINYNNENILNPALWN